ncbi:MAG TPA: SMI1/KNR4 family protein [Herpetosiphonaceae bacterium]
MPLTFDHGTQPPATQRELRLIETLWRIRLPPVYRAFLMSQNGGVPSLVRFEAKASSYTINAFYAIAANQPYDDLCDALYTFYGRVPDDLIPIAYDPYGSQFCIGIDGRRFGKIYFWDHAEESEEESGEYYENTYLLANSLDEFFAGLSERR